MAKKDFPDLTGDGKVTQKDILKGRGVFNTGGKVKKKGMAVGGMAKGMPAGGMKKKKKGMAAGGMMKKKKGMAAGGMAKKKKGYAMGGPMKKKGYAMGGPMKKKGYSKGGAAGGKRKGKVRGVRIATKGFRPAKMVKMKGS